MADTGQGWDFTGLSAMYINGTLKRSQEVSNTEGLIEVSASIMRRHGVEVEVLRTIDHDIATGVYPDMTQHGWASDEWPQIWERVSAANILVYLDEGSGGPENDFTNRNTTFMTWNLKHLARMIEQAGGIPANGNSHTGWDNGERFDFVQPNR